MRWQDDHASKSDRIADSPDAYLRPTKDRLERKRRRAED